MTHLRNPSSSRPAAARRRLLAGGTALAAIFASLGLAACGSSGTSSADSTNAATSTVSASTLAGTTLNVATFGPYVEALYKASGAFNDLPFKIHWVDNVDEAQPLFSAEAGGSVDVGSMGDLPVSSGVAANAAFKIIDIGTDLSANGIPASTGLALVVPKNSSIHSAKDFEGKTLVTTQGSEIEYIAYLYLKNHGVPWSSVKLRYLTEPQGLTAFLSGDVDAWASYPPGTSQVLSDGKARLIASSVGPTNPLKNPQLILTASNQALANPAKVAAIHAYVKALTRANAWELAHLKQLPAIIAKAQNLPVAQVGAEYLWVVFNQKPIDSQQIQNFQTTVDNAHDAGILPSAAAVKPFFDSDFQSDIQGG